MRSRGIAPEDEVRPERIERPRRAGRKIPFADWLKDADAALAFDA